MAILDKAKFLLIPSGYKSAKVYSIFPSSGGFDFTFSRVGDDATRQNINSLIETKSANIPRLNHHNNGCPSLLLEGSTTNFQIKSEDFSNSAWIKVNTTITSNQIVSPNGELNADKLSRNTTLNNYMIDSVNKPTQQLDYTISIFVKQGEGDFFAMRLQGEYPNRGEAIYQFSTNTLTTTVDGNNFTVTTSKVENYGNGWFRLSASFITDSYNQLSDGFSPRSTNGTIDQNDPSANAFAYIFGAQVSQESGISSYIKTDSLQVTRNFDDCVNTSTFTLGADSTFYFDFEVDTYKSNGERLFTCTNAGTTKFLRLQTHKSGTNYFSYVTASSNNGTSNTLISTSENLIPFFQHNKLAIRLFGNSFIIFVNGSQVKTGTVTGNFDVLNGEAIISDFGESVTNNSTRKIFAHAIFDETLTSSDLTKLTTI